LYRQQREKTRMSSFRIDNAAQIKEWCRVSESMRLEATIEKEYDDEQVG